MKIIFRHDLTQEVIVIEADEEDKNYDINLFLEFSYTIKNGELEITGLKKH